jgi:predicted ATPase
MVIEQPNFFAITGGPGAGKTTLIRRLQMLGETCFEESARLILQADARNGRARPAQSDLAERCLSRDMAQFRQAAERGRRAFFDRSIVDAWGMASLGPAADEAVRTLRYNRTAFIAPPWRAIYVNDAERIQSWDQAIAAFESCAEAYLAAGYELLELPLAGVGERAAFVLDSLPNSAV